MKTSLLFLSLLLLISLGSNAQQQKDSLESYIKQPKNHLHFAMSDIIFKRISFEYERVLGEEQKIALKIPVSYAFGEIGGVDNYVGPVNLSDMPLWYVGLGFNLYPKGQGKFRFYFGAEFRVGDAKHYDQLNFGYVDDHYVEPELVEWTYFQTAFLANAGILYEPVDRFIVGLNLGVGAGNGLNNNVVEIINPTFRVGLKF